LLSKFYLKNQPWWPFFLFIEGWSQNIGVHLEGVHGKAFFKQRIFSIITLWIIFKNEKSEIL